jgi:tetratricopeptide (TPR) repeat protein
MTPSLRESEKARSAFEAARQQYAAFLRDRGGEQPEVLSHLAMVDAALGRKEEALPEGRRAVELRPISRDAVNGPIVAKNLAVVYSWVGERDRAFEELSSIIRLPGELTYGDSSLRPGGMNCAAIRASSKSSRRLRRKT